MHANGQIGHAESEVLKWRVLPIGDK
jgi:hypothetical protein